MSWTHGVVFKVLLINLVKYAKNVWISKSERKLKVYPRVALGEFKSESKRILLRESDDWIR